MGIYKRGKGGWNGRGPWAEEDEGRERGGTTGGLKRTGENEGSSGEAIERMLWGEGKACAFVCCEISARLFQVYVQDLQSKSKPIYEQSNITEASSKTGGPVTM